MTEIRILRINYVFENARIHKLYLTTWHAVYIRNQYWTFKLNGQSLAVELIGLWILKLFSKQDSYGVIKAFCQLSRKKFTWDATLDIIHGELKQRVSRDWKTSGC